MSEQVFHPENQCHGKRRHATRRDARVVRNDTRGGGHLRIYKCPHCGWFHLGHPRPAPEDPREDPVARLAEFWDCTTDEARERFQRELQGG